MVEEKDIVQLEAEIERLRKLAYYDELTGLLNRRGFEDEAGRAFRAIPFRHRDDRRHEEFRLPFSIIFFDVDNFKSVNDTYGHEAGDRVLQAVARAIQHRLRTSDIYARWGGEEFVAILLGADIEAGQTVAENLRRDIEEAKIETSGGPISVTVSLGLMDYQGEETLGEMLAKADAAMYRAKQAGKNRVEIFVGE